MDLINKFLGYFRNSEMLNSKKFRAFITGLAMVLLKHFGVIDLDPDLVNSVVALALGYMGFQGGVDMVKAYSGFYNNASK